MNSSSQQISKLISYWLRHNPGDAGLTVDDFGWISVQKLLMVLDTRNLQIDLKSLNELANSFDKVRWEFDESGTRIRATHGHSFPVLLDDKVQLPPQELYHGTSVKSVLQIAEKGLLAMNRQFVHLSETVETALIVGKRHGKPIIIEIDTEQLVKDGWKFYKTSDNVWLTSDMPVKYLEFKPWYPTKDADDFKLNELRKEIGNRPSHVLYHQLKDLNMVWRGSASDDCLFQNQNSGECFMVHLTYSSGQEQEGWPHIEKYQTIEEWIEKGLWNDQQVFYDLI